MRRASEASLSFLGFPREKKPLHNGSYEHRVPKNKNNNSSAQCVWFNIAIGRLGRPYYTHTAPIAVPTGSTHAHILTSPTCAITWYVVQRWRRQMRKRVFLQGLWLRLGHGLAIFKNSKNWSNVFCFFTRYKCQYKKYTITFFFRSKTFTSWLQDVLLLLLSFLLWCSDDRRKNTRTRTPWCIADCLLQVLRSRLITTNYYYTVWVEFSSGLLSFVPGKSWVMDSDNGR